MLLEATGSILTHTDFGTDGSAKLQPSWGNSMAQKDRFPFLKVVHKLQQLVPPSSTQHCILDTASLWLQDTVTHPYSKSSPGGRRSAMWLGLL